MARIMTVGEAAKTLDIRPQVINGFIRKADGPLDWVVQEKPVRKIDLDMYNEWVAARDSQPRKPRTSRRNAETGEVVANSTFSHLRMSIKERKLFSWSRGKGRGWALAQPEEETMNLNSDYLELTNHRGDKHPTTFTRLLTEVEEGKLFFIDLDMAMAFIVQQLDALNTETASDETAAALESARATFNAIMELKQARTAMSTEVDHVGPSPEEEEEAGE